MAQVTNFPAIKPSGRAWQLASPPAQTFTTLSGYEARVRYGSQAIGASLSLSFQNLKEAKVSELVAHYTTAGGILNFFSLPAETTAGMSSTAAASILSARWRYAEAPGIEWVAPGIASVSCSLVSVFD